MGNLYRPLYSLESGVESVSHNGGITMWHQEDQLLLEEATQEPLVRRHMFCDACNEVTRHTVEYHGTEGFERCFIVKLKRTCQHRRELPGRDDYGKRRYDVCGLATSQYMRIKDWNALITNDYWQ